MPLSYYRKLDNETGARVDRLYLRIPVSGAVVRVRTVHIENAAKATGLSNETSARVEIRYVLYQYQVLLEYTYG